jgi:hypothetical protein
MSNEFCGGHVVGVHKVQNVPSHARVGHIVVVVMVRRRQWKKAVISVVAQVETEDTARLLQSTTQRSGDGTKVAFVAQ